MDPTPNCAICNAPTYPDQDCPCEADRLQVAVKEAEQRFMQLRLAEIRSWAIDRSREQIMERFKRLTHSRKIAHNRYLSELPYYTIYMQYSGHPPLSPYIIATLQAQISEAHAELKRGIDADWRASIMEYPKVLDYFYGMVEVRLPQDLDTASTSDRGGGGQLARRRQGSGSVEPPYSQAVTTPRDPTAPRMGSRRNRNSRDASEPPDHHGYERRSKRRDSISYVMGGPGGGGGGGGHHHKRLSTVPMAPMAPMPPPTPSYPGAYPGAYPY